MNVPGRAGGNWRWRCPADMPLMAFQWLRDPTQSSMHSAGREAVS